MPEPLIIQEQGSFAAGGTVITDPEGRTLHGDHAYAFYQVPAGARRYPLVLWHGAGQFSKTWETTPDGRDGFQNIFLRRNFAVYLVDQPRRGDAGRSTQPIAIAPSASSRAPPSSVSLTAAHRPSSVNAVIAVTGCARWE